LAKPLGKIVDDKPYYHIDVDFVFAMTAAYFFLPPITGVYTQHVSMPWSV